MPKPKWNLNTIYISERLQESLRPISRCAMTTVVAPMGYGKTTAVNWYLEERAKRRHCTSSASAYTPATSPSSGKAYRRRLPARVSSSCGNILAPRTRRAVDCWWMTSAMRWRTKHPAISFIDDFHLLTDKRASLFLCMLANRLPINVHLIVASRDRFCPLHRRCGWGKGLSDRHGAAAPEPYGACHLCPPLRHGAFRSAG